MANRYEKLCLAALKDLKVEVEWIVWIVGKVIRFMIRLFSLLFSLCCPSQWSCPTSKGIRQHYLIWRPEEVTKMDKWEDFDQIEADRLLAEQMQAQMTSSESEESGRSGQTSKIILCIHSVSSIPAHSFGGLVLQVFFGQFGLVDAGIWLLTQNFEGPHVSCWYIFGVGELCRYQDTSYTWFTI